MVTILLVEDDPAVRLLVKAKLRNRYRILEACDGEAALQVLDTAHADLMIVDICMPRMDGITFVRTIRGQQDNTPVIMLTAMNTFDHKKKSFSSGIDEYLTKPIDSEELEWHIEALLRRARISAEKKIVTGGLELSEEKHSAVLNGAPVDLTETEFKLLFKLLSYPGVVFTRQQLMDDIWGFDSESDYSTIKTYISRLRAKFEDCQDFELIAARGLGYKAEIRKDEADQK